MTPVARTIGTRLVGAAVLLASVSVVVCCGGDSYGEDPGAEGGPCYANGTCNAGLVCASARCVRLAVPSDAGTADSGGSDSGREDGGADAAADAAGDAEGGAASSCSVPAQAPGVVCESASGSLAACGTGSLCCVDDRSCKADPSLCGTNKVIECLSQADCGGGEVCCALASAAQVPGECPTISALSKAVCKASCTASETMLCWGNGVCPGSQTCSGAKLVVDFGNDGNAVKTLDVGACR